MKKILTLLTVCIATLQAIQCQNMALHLDGKDNNVRTGIGFMKAPWTLEAWIKGDDTSWKETEVIFGGGEYSTYSHADNYPLVVRQGKLYSTRAGIGTQGWLDDNWHHVALTCNGKNTSLYIDGMCKAQKDTAVTIIPGAIGVSEYANEVFGGLIDEVRIWSCALTPETLRKWMYCPLNDTHTAFRNLIAYYNFDAGINDTALNWVGGGYHSYHLRNGRVAYNGNGNIAYTVPNDNKKFKEYHGTQKLFNAVSVEREWSVDRGSKENQMAKLRIITMGKELPMRLEGLTLDLSETDHLNGLSDIKVYYTGQTARSPRRDLLATYAAKKQIRITLPPKKQVQLSEGANYILVTADVKGNAKTGTKIRIKISSYTLNGENKTPRQIKPYVDQRITENSSTNSNVFRVVQWNIWHGGRHVPLQGYERIIELLKASKADIITMQEGYGFQKQIADALHYHLQTPGHDDNLCLYSHFPLEKQTSSDSFCSNPAIIRMGNGHSVLVDNCWLHYAYHPDYTGSFPDPQHDPSHWVAEDSIRPMADAQRMLDKDLAPVLLREDMPVILGGDFNSCSHLDWTAKAAPLHGGHGPVSFPTSRFLIERGYKDSFREMNPDEMARPEGTFAGIYGQLDFNRIDFLYYKGNIQAISSSIIQTAPEIDDIWASDHSAVVTTFKWNCSSIRH